jgi:hypothetical protein
MDQKEQVRIAVSKALGKLLSLLTLKQEELPIGEEGMRFEAHLQLLYSLVILLNDE